MTNISVIEFIQTVQHTPVLSSRHASTVNRRRIQTDQMRLRQLPDQSMLLYMIHGAACDTPDRITANEQLENEGFLSYRRLVPLMRKIFSDIWPTES